MAYMAKRVGMGLCLCYRQPIVAGPEQHSTRETLKCRPACDRSSSVVACRFVYHRSSLIVICVCVCVCCCCFVVLLGPLVVVFVGHNFVCWPSLRIICIYISLSLYIYIYVAVYVSPLYIAPLPLRGRLWVGQKLD